jgi:hypothetical protein
MHGNGRQRISTGGFGPVSEFGFEKLLRFFGLPHPLLKPIPTKFGISSISEKVPTGYTKTLYLSSA